MTQAQNRSTEQPPGLSQCVPLDQPSSYYGAVFPRRDLRGKELRDKLDLAVRGFTVNERAVPLQGLLLLLLLAAGTGGK